MVLKQRTIGQTSVRAMASRPQTDLVNVATLVRGRVYFYKDQKFEVGKPTVVSNELANILEELHEEISDADGERFEKPFFYVQRGVPRPQEAQERTKPPARRLPVRLPAHLAR
jgi:hypothetical protein